MTSKPCDIFIVAWPYVHFHQGHSKVEENVNLAAAVSNFKYKS